MTFIRSFLVAGIVAVLLGFALRNVFGFWETMALAFVAQFLVAFIYSSFKINNNTTLITDFDNELNQLLDLSETSIPCPCGNFVYTDNIFVSLEHGYTCEKCNNEFRIDISLTPTLLTTPLNVGFDFDKNTEENTEEKTDNISITQEYTKGTEL